MYRKWGLVRCPAGRPARRLTSAEVESKIWNPQKNHLHKAREDWGVGVDTRELALLLTWQDILLQRTCTMPLIGQEIPVEWADDCGRNCKKQRFFSKRICLGIARMSEQAHILTLRNCG
jgi:hypothetical protein